MLNRLLEQLEGYGCNVTEMEIEDFLSDYDLDLVSEYDLARAFNLYVENELDTYEAANIPESEPSLLEKIKDTLDTNKDTQILEKIENYSERKTEETIEQIKLTMAKVQEQLDLQQSLLAQTILQSKEHLDKENDLIKQTVNQGNHLVVSAIAKIQSTRLAALCVLPFVCILLSIFAVHSFKAKQANETEQFKNTVCQVPISTNYLCEK